MSSLTTREIEVLDFERDWAVNGGSSSKRKAIESTFGFTPSWYYQTLTSAMMNPAAAVYDPLLVRRWHRRRREEKKTQYNAAGTTGGVGDA